VQFADSSLTSAAPIAAGDEDLVRAAAHDTRARNELVQRYVGDVYRYSRSLSESAEEAADLAQDVLLRAMIALPRYRPTGAPFRIWLFRIARNAAFDRRRKSRRSPPSVPAWQSDEIDPQDAVLRADDLSRIGAAVADLDADARDLLTLRFAAGLTSREISGVVGKSESAVKKQLSRLLRRLREALNE
jgi:RNA polymerase sigma-70 factor (ECF subfamily)